MIYMSLDGEYRRFNEGAATWLGGNNEYQGRWNDLYLSAKGRLVLVNISIWENEPREVAEEIDEQRAIGYLSRCDNKSGAGSEWLETHVPEE